MLRGTWLALTLTGALLLTPLLPSTAGAAADPPPTAVAIAGDFNSEIGCTADWAPDCDQAQATRRANDGVWALTVNLPGGSYAYKAALNRSWDVSYGLHAAPGGANIPLTVPAAGSAVVRLRFAPEGEPAGFADFDSIVAAVCRWSRIGGDARRFHLRHG